MSLQQVNLYQDELRKQKINFSAMQLVQITLVLLVLLVLVSGFKVWQLQQHQQALAVQQQKQKQVMAEMQQLQQKLSLRQKDVILAKRLADKTKEFSNKQKVLAILSQDEFGNTKGFIEQITGLARQRLDGLWLTQLRIAEGGTDVSMYGTTSNPSLLPKYLQRLSAEKAFTGTQFKNMLIARQKKKSQWLDFSLQNQKANGVTP
jgi:hypothetical protein